MNYSTVNDILASCTKGTPIEIIYDSGSWPGVPRNVEFISLYYLSNSQSSMYLDVYEKGQYKTFCVESISSVQKKSVEYIPPTISVQESFSKGNILRFTYNKLDESTERTVEFVKYLNPKSKTILQCIENGQIKNFKNKQIENPTIISTPQSPLTENEVLKQQLFNATSRIQELEQLISSLSIGNSNMSPYH